MVKAACLIVEMMEVVSSKFQFLQVRCQTIRSKLTKVVRAYMNQVQTEAEMKYLLLEKDFEHRDSLDLITRYQIVEFLES